MGLVAQGVELAVQLCDPPGAPGEGLVGRDEDVGSRGEVGRGTEYLDIERRRCADEVLVGLDGMAVIALA